MDCIFGLMTVWKSTIWIRTEIITDEIIWPYSIGIVTTRFMRSVYDKHQAVEEPCDSNLSSTVL